MASLFAIRYPKIPRLAGVSARDWSAWSTHHAVAEEKVDGANVGIWFENDDLRLQSRGYVLRGGPKEAQFGPLYAWASYRYEKLRNVLGPDFVVYGEWCFATHRTYYDALPDWLLVFDVLNRQTGRFLPVVARNLIALRIEAQTVPALWSGKFGQAPALSSLIERSRFKSPSWKQSMASAAKRAGCKAKSASVDTMEGVVMRIEDPTGVVGRVKVHRPGYEKAGIEDVLREPFVRNALRV